MMRPMSEAPRDRSFILALYRPPEGHREARFRERWFSVFHEGVTPSCYDMGWALYPGYGGVPDDHFAGWMPLPDSDANPTPPERARALEEAARIMDARAAMYRTKAERHYPLAPDSLTEHERFISNAEASEHGAAAIRALSASPTEGVEGELGRAGKGE